MYYSYYMLPDGTYCLAPPPPGIDVATYYNALPAGVTVSSTTGVATVPPPPGTTPPPPPDTTESSSGLTSATTSTRYRIQICLLVGGAVPPELQREAFRKGSVIGDCSFAGVYTASITSALVCDVVCCYCYPAIMKFLCDGKSDYFNCIMNPESKHLCNVFLLKQGLKDICVPFMKMTYFWFFSTIAPVVAIIPPPPDIQPVIDKLAEYVARNGIKFETSVRAKNDLR